MGFPAILSELPGFQRKVRLDFLAGKSIVIDGSNLFHSLVGKLPDSAQDPRLWADASRTICEFLSVCSFVYVVYDGKQLPCKYVQRHRQTAEPDKWMTTMMEYKL